MYMLYRGDPERGGVLIGYFETAAAARRAMQEDSRRRAAGTAYYLINTKYKESENE